VDGWDCQLSLLFDDEGDSARGRSPSLIGRIWPGQSAASRASQLLEVQLLLPAKHPPPMSASKRSSESMEPTGPSASSNKRPAAELPPSAVRDLLIFTCSPSAARLGGLDAEVADIAKHLPYNADIRHQRGGTPDLLREYLLHKTTRMFVFAGHANVLAAPIALVGDGDTSTAMPLTLTLGFTNSSGGLVEVDPLVVIDLLKTVKELVVLNGCNSEALGNSICEAGVPAVVGWRTKVLSAAASIFSSGLFEALGMGHDVAAAFRAARSKVATVTRPGMNTALGLACDVPYYALVDPEDVQPASVFDPAPLAVGIPVLLRPNQPTLA